MSRSSHLDHPGSQSSLVSLSLSFSPSLLNPRSGPNHPTSKLPQHSALLKFTTLFIRSLSVSTFLSLFLVPLFSLSFWGCFSLSHSFSVSPPLPSPFTQASLLTALKRQFPETFFPPWEESTFEGVKLGFNSPVAGKFITRAILKHEILVLVWQHDQNWKKLK